MEEEEEEAVAEEEEAAMAEAKEEEEVAAAAAAEVPFLTPAVYILGRFSKVYFFQIRCLRNYLRENQSLL